MGFGVLELIKAVQVGSGIVPVSVQALLCPSWKGFVSVIKGHMSTHVVAKLAPCDELVQKGFGTPSHAPPTLTLSSPARPNPILGQCLMIYQVMNHLMD